MCEVGWPVENREKVDNRGFTMVAPDKRLCRGHVTKWIYQRNISQVLASKSDFQAIVFRPILGSGTEFKIIGITSISGRYVQTGTPVIYKVPLYQRIEVEEGDVIGWSTDNGIIPYNVGGPSNIRLIDLRNGLEIGQKVDIKARVQKREYSIKAVVEGMIYYIVSKTKQTNKQTKTNKQIKTNKKPLHPTHPNKQTNTPRNQTNTPTSKQASKQTNKQKQTI